MTFDFQPQKRAHTHTNGTLKSLQHFPLSMDDICNRNKKKSGQMIPEFGNWDYVNDLPITQYFDSARQAGLLPYTDSHLYSASPDFHKPPQPTHRPNKANGVQRSRVPCKGADRARRHQKKNSNDAVMRVRKMKDQNGEEFYKRNVKIVNIVGKPVDEDLYKIPPELLLHTPKKKKMLKFFRKCLLPGCAA